MQWAQVLWSRQVVWNLTYQVFKTGFAISLLDYFIQIKSQEEALRNRTINSVSTMKGLSESLTKAKEFVVVVIVIFDKPLMVCEICLAGPW